MSDNGNYGQVSVNREILRQEKASMEADSAPDEITDRVALLTAQVIDITKVMQVLFPAVKALQQRKPFDGAKFGEEIADIVRDYIERRLDKVAEDITMGDRRTCLIVEEMLADFRAETANGVKAALPRRRIKALSRPYGKDLQ